MKCAECGQALPAGAQFCTACGTRIAEKPEPAIVRKPPPPDPRMTTEPALTRRPLSLDARVPPGRPVTAPPPGAVRNKRDHVPARVRFAPWLRHLPAAAVAAGVTLGVAILLSAQHDRANAEKAGSDRIAAATGPLSTSQRGRVDFSPRQALQGLFGNSDPHLDGAYWTVTGAPADRAEWNG